MIITNSSTQNKIISPKSRSDYSLSPERDEPYHLSLDKDDYFHLSSEMDEVYYSLLRTLKRKKGFGLFFVVLSSPIKIDKIITRLQKDLPQKTIHDLEIDRQATTLYDQIAEVYQQTKCDILCFKNLESALYDYEDTKRLSGWSEEEAYAYSWKGVPPILNHLNQQRERLSRDFPFSLVFFVPSFAIDYLIQRAPDFFDWRSGVFRFLFTDQELSEQLTEFIQGDLDIYLSFTPEQRVEKILGIRDLILAADRDTEATAKLYFEQSLLFLSGNQYNKAIERLNKVIELQPNNYNALVYKSFILIKCERYNEALICLDRIIELKFSQSVEVKPNDYQIWAVHGDVLRKLERYEEALVSYDRAININSDDYKVWALRCDILNSLERYEEALVSCDRAININSDDYKVWAVRCDVLDSLERYEESLVSCDRAININSDDYQIWRLRGIVLDSLERYEEALVSYNRAIELQSNDDISLNNYGVNLANNDRYDEALLYFNKAIDLKPDKSQYLSNIGRSLRFLKRYEEAIEVYKKAIKIDKRSTSFYNNLSRLYFLQGKSQLAINLLTRAIEAKLINDSLVWNNLGFLYLITNNLKKARISFNSALQRKANDFLPTFNLALVNARQNKIKLAKQLIEKSLNLCKDDTIQHKLYIAIAKIALGKEKDGLQNIKNILETAKNSSLSLEQEVRCGVLESAQILAEHPDFLGMKEAVNILEQALQT